MHQYEGLHNSEDWHYGSRARLSKGNAMANLGGSFDGETTPPTNYDSPQHHAYAYSHEGRPSDDHRGSRPLGLIFTLLGILLLLIGSFVYFVFTDRGDDSSDALATTSVEETTISSETSTFATADPTTSNAEETPPTADTSNYADPSQIHLFDTPAQHLAVRNLELQGAGTISEAFVDKLAVMAEDPSTPDTIPTMVEGIDAGPVGEFTCTFNNNNDTEFNQGVWDCRGDQDRQVLFFPLLPGTGYGVAEPRGVTPNMFANMTPSDPNWKARAIEGAKTPNKNPQL